MKACEAYVDLIMRSIDLETTPQEEAELQAHLSSCEACRTLYVTYRQIDQNLAAIEEEPPQALTGAIMNSIRAEKQHRSPRHWLKQFRFTAVAAVAAVLVLVFARIHPDVASVTGRGAAMSNDTTAAQAAVEFRAGDIAPAAEAAEAAEMPELEDASKETAKEEAVAEDTEAAAEEMEAPVAADESLQTSVELSEQAEALHAMGLSGDILRVTGITEEAVLELFQKVTTINLETGIVAYEVSVADADAAAAAGEIAIAQIYSDESGNDHCFIILTD